MTSIKHCQLVSLKKRMSLAFELDDWQGLADLDKECQQTVLQIIEEDPRAMFDELREMLGFYSTLIANCETQRDQYAKEVKQMRKSKQSSQTYQAVGQVSAVSHY
jgi:hypothetical protein